MTPSFQRLEPNAARVGCGVAGAWFGSRVMGRGLRPEGAAMNPVLPGIAVHQSS